MPAPLTAAAMTAARAAAAVGMAITLLRGDSAKARLGYAARN